MLYLRGVALPAASTDKAYSASADAQSYSGARTVIRHAMSILSALSPSSAMMLMMSTPNILALARSKKPPMRAVVSIAVYVVNRLDLTGLAICTASPRPLGLPGRIDSRHQGPLQREEFFTAPYRF